MFGCDFTMDWDDWPWGGWVPRPPRPPRRPKPPFGGPGHGRGHRGHWFGSGQMKYVVLSLLAERPMHGYEIMKVLEERTHGHYKPSPGAIYPTLQWLEDESLVRSEEKDGKKIYAITDAGRAFLDDHRPKVEEIFDRVAEMVGRLSHDPIPRITEAIGEIVKQATRMGWRTIEDVQIQDRIGDILETAAEELKKAAESVKRARAAAEDDVVDAEFGEAEAEAGSESEDEDE